VALGNAGDPAAVPDLGQALLGESEPLVRAHAAWALGRIGGRQAHALLDQAAQMESDPQVQEEIQSALAMEPKR
jgi:epoxyqueuosine reductase